MKTFLFTHTDYDGVACAVAATTVALAKGEDVDVSYVNYSYINKTILEFIEKAETFTERVRVHITDICPEGEEGKEICKKLDDMHKAGKISMFLCDHHDTSTWVKEYPWAWHEVHDETCGTKLYMDFLQTCGHTFSKEALEFGECTCVYDNWLLDHPLRKRAEGINKYMYFIGFSKFVHAFSHDPAADLSLTPAAIIEQLGKNEKSYVKKVIRQQCTGDFVLYDKNGDRYCVLTAEKNASQICHAALDAFPELDYVMNLNPMYDKGDLRSRKNGVDVSKIAEKLGGGGRAQTAGFQMPLRGVLLLALKNTV